MAVESITFFFPAYNERTNVGRTIEETLQVIRELAIPEWEILFVDDGSSDGTAQVIESHSVRHPSIRVVRHLSTKVTAPQCFPGSQRPAAIGSS